MARNFSPLVCRSLVLFALAVFGVALLSPRCSIAQQPAAQKPAAPAPAPAAPDTLVLSDGDILHGKLVSALAGKVTFHTDSLGDVALTWDKIKELHTGQKFAVLDKSAEVRGRVNASRIPAGTLDVTGQAVTVHVEGTAAAPAIPIKNAEYVVDQPTLNKQLHEPGFFDAWNGTATAGATIVTATQDQYTATGTTTLVRAVPVAPWLSPRNRTTVNFSGSYGKIVEPDTPTEKTSIYHAGAERDQYFSPRVYALGQTTFDHNFSQGLALQSVFGGGLGWTALKKAQQTLDLKGSVQYESQQFIATAGAASTPSENLIGATISANYAAKLKLVTITQTLAFVPAFNVSNAYSANETDTLAFPAYRNFSFTVGTLDSYLNDSPLTTAPPTKPNSFQFTMGITYTIKSKY